MTLTKKKSGGEEKMGGWMDRQMDEQKTDRLKTKIKL